MNEKFNDFNDFDKKLVVGVDPSLRSLGLSLIRGFEIVDFNNITACKNPHKYNNRFERYNSMVYYIIKTINDWKNKFGKIDIIVIEGYSYGSHGSATITLAELGGIIRNTIIKTGIPFIEVSPPKIKKFVLKGNSNKDECHNKLKKLFPQYSKVKSEDVFDAIMCGLYGLFILNSCKIQYDKNDIYPFDVSAIKQTINHIKNKDNCATDQCIHIGIKIK